MSDFMGFNPPDTRTINTQEKLLSYIKRQLGHPVIRVEVPDESIEDIIYETVSKFTEYNWEGEVLKTLVIQTEGKGSYQFKDEVLEVTQVRTGNGGLASFAQNYGQGYVPDLWIDQNHSTSDIMSSMIQLSTAAQISEKYLSLEPNWSFSGGKNMLILHEDYKGPLLVQYQARYTPGDIDYIYNHTWVKEYQIQRVKFLWGTITGKYSQTLVGGAQINYSDMKQEAETELQRLHEELLTKYTDPGPISIF